MQASTPNRITFVDRDGNRVTGDIIEVKPYAAGSTPVPQEPLPGFLVRIEGGTLEGYAHVRKNVNGHEYAETLDAWRFGS